MLVYFRILKDVCITPHLPAPKYFLIWKFNFMFKSPGDVIILPYSFTNITNGFNVMSCGASSAFGYHLCDGHNIFNLQVLWLQMHIPWLDFFYIKTLLLCSSRPLQCALVVCITRYGIYLRNPPNCILLDYIGISHDCNFVSH